MHPRGRGVAGRAAIPDRISPWVNIFPTPACVDFIVFLADLHQGIRSDLVWLVARIAGLLPASRIDHPAVLFCTAVRAVQLCVSCPDFRDSCSSFQSGQSFDYASLIWAVNGAWMAGNHRLQRRFLSCCIGHLQSATRRSPNVPAAGRLSGARGAFPVSYCPRRRVHPGRLKWTHQSRHSAG